MSRHGHTLNQTHTHPHHAKRQPAYVAHFVALHVYDAKIVAARTGIPAEVILAQSALESNWGRTVKGNAYFGIKGKSASGQSTKFSTHEVTLSGKRISEIDEFRAYKDYDEAAADYASLIQTKYPTALASRSDPEKFAEAVARQGYATDPFYAKKLKSIIRSHIVPLLNDKQLNMP
ncbi:MAG TPA: glucosaminidase domain-containing protein [Burkholderiaceae bacterium]|nr:glucosaminidase domain-containing protein [Burkholderiaceae bacterium]